MSYLDKLVYSAQKTGSIACMGLDIVPELLPNDYKNMGISGAVPFIDKIFREMSRQRVFPGAFKPNQGFYTAYDNLIDGKFDGSIALSKILNLIKEYFPDIPIILDSKRGDIKKSSANYAKEGYVSCAADAVTVSPYMGSDSMNPFIDFCNETENNGLYILCRTSNKSAVDFQDLIDVETGLRLYEKVALKIVEWAEGHPGVGAVVGATSPQELGELAQRFAKERIPLLIPGVGSQGGSAEEVMEQLKEAEYEIPIVRINSSSRITSSWGKNPVPRDYVKVCVEKLYDLNKAIGF